MVSITLGIPDFKFDGSKSYEELKMEMINKEAAKHNQAKTSAEDRSIGREIKYTVPSSE
jgi:primosomal protein N''